MKFLLWRCWGLAAVFMATAVMARSSSPPLRGRQKTISNDVIFDISHLRNSRDMDTAGTVSSGNSSPGDCSTDRDCPILYNFDLAESYQNPILVQKMVCLKDENATSGTCSCAEGYCHSRGMSYFEGNYFEYCGPCGRIGSQCANESQCYDPFAECDAWCRCPMGELSLDLYYCVYVYQGYEKALEVALFSSILVAVALLFASVYSTIRGRRGMNPAMLRLMLRQNHSRSEPPPGDHPPQYDTVVGGEAPPSYQEALRQMGRDNPSFVGSQGELGRPRSEGPSRSSSLGGHSLRAQASSPSPTGSPSPSGRPCRSNSLPGQLGTGGSAEAPDLQRRSEDLVGPASPDALSSESPANLDANLRDSAKSEPELQRSST